MLRIIKIISKCSLHIILPAVFLLPVFSGDAMAQFCSVGICKSAADSGGTEFPFAAIGTETVEFSLLGEGEGSCTVVDFNQGQTVTVNEEFFPGWVLDDIECNLVGVDFVVEEDGVRMECDVPTVNGTCVFTNVRGEFSAPIPTLSEWGMIAAAAGLGLVGVFFAMRRRRALAS
jgi:exosortase sorting signal-containing protein